MWWTGGRGEEDGGWGGFGGADGGWNRTGRWEGLGLRGEVVGDGVREVGKVGGEVGVSLKGDHGLERVKMELRRADLGSGRVGQEPGGGGGRRLGCKWEGQGIFGAGMGSRTGSWGRSGLEDYVRMVCGLVLGFRQPHGEVAPSARICPVGIPVGSGSGFLGHV